jgi:hypothetical protein
VPTLVEHEQPQLLLVSTAHRKATPLIPERRNHALSVLGAPGDRDLLVEWSAPRGCELDDRGAWRMASPRWTAQREGVIADKVARALLGEVLDATESDPVQFVLAQWLNVWPTVLVSVSGPGESLDTAGLWAKCEPAPGAAPVRLWVAVEDNYGDGACVVAVGLLPDGRFEVDGWLCASRSAALDDAAAVAAQADRSEVIVGASIPTRRRVSRGGATETRVGLPMVRSMLADGVIVHDPTPELDVQLERARVRQGGGGLVLVPRERGDMVRALAWALLAAADRKPTPGIR